MKIITTLLLLLPTSLTAKPRIESAYLGALDIRFGAPLSAVSGCSQNAGDDGMPMVMSVQINASTLDAGDFRVISRNEAVSTPTCATLRPADEANELHTILLAGPIAGADDLPDHVVIVGHVEDVDGNVLTGLISPTVTIGPDTGASLVDAYLFDKPGGPAGSSLRAIQLVWQGGVTGPNGADPGTNQLNAIRVIDCDGVAHTPLGMDDLDDVIATDNYVEIYIPESVVANRIEVDAGAFFDPLNVPNPATSVDVTSLLPPAACTQLQVDFPTDGFNRLQFLGTPGVPYRVFFSKDMMEWNCVGASYADQTTGEFHIEHDTGLEPKGFYRSTP